MSYFSHTQFGVLEAIKAASSTFPSQAESLKATGKSSNKLGMHACLLGVTLLETFFLYVVFASCSLDTRFSFPSHQLLEFVLSTMAARQKSMSSSLMGTLVASCLLHMALWVQGGAAVPIVSQCRLDRANFQQPYITNRTFALAHEVLISLFLSFFCILIYLEAE